jgi:hypothetical protein
MLTYWEYNANGVQEVNFDTDEDDEECETHKPQMKKG